MRSLRERYEELRESGTWERDRIRAQIRELEDYKPRNIEDFETREAEIKRLRELLL